MLNSFRYYDMFWLKAKSTDQRDSITVLMQSDFLCKVDGHESQ